MRKACNQMINLINDVATLLNLKDNPQSKIKRIFLIFIIQYGYMELFGLRRNISDAVDQMKSQWLVHDTKMSSSSHILLIFARRGMDRFSMTI